MAPLSGPVGVDRCMASGCAVDNPIEVGHEGSYDFNNSSNMVKRANVRQQRFLCRQIAGQMSVRHLLHLLHDFWFCTDTGLSIGLSLAVGPHLSSNPRNMEASQCLFVGESNTAAGPEQYCCRMLPPSCGFCFCHCLACRCKGHQHRAAVCKL